MSRPTGDVVAQLGFTSEMARLDDEISGWIAKADGEICDALQWQFQGGSKYFRPLTIFPPVTSVPLPETIR